MTSICQEFVTVFKALILKFLDLNLNKDVELCCRMPPAPHRIAAHQGWCVFSPYVPTRSRDWLLNVSKQNIVKIQHILELPWVCSVWDATACVQTWGAGAVLLRRGGTHGRWQRLRDILVAFLEVCSRLGWTCDSALCPCSPSGSQQYCQAGISALLNSASRASWKCRFLSPVCDSLPMQYVTG